MPNTSKRNFKQGDRVGEISTEAAQWEARMRYIALLDKLLATNETCDRRNIMEEMITIAQTMPRIPNADNRDVMGSLSPEANTVPWLTDPVGTPVQKHAMSQGANRRDLTTEVPAGSYLYYDHERNRWCTGVSETCSFTPIASRRSFTDDWDERHGDNRWQQSDKASLSAQSSVYVEPMHNGPRYQYEGRGKKRRAKQMGTESERQTSRRRQSQDRNVNRIPRSRTSPTINQDKFLQVGPRPCLTCVRFSVRI